MVKKSVKNLQKVQEMLDGKFGGYKPQVGYGDQESKSDREIGDIWTDSDGVKWEQKNGYRSKISHLNVGLFSKQCKDCNKNCSIDKRHRATYNRMGRCFYCQIDFEAMLKTKGTWHYWVRLQQLNNLDVLEKEAEQIVFEIDKERKEKLFDMSVANAISNANLDMTIKKNRG